jgi:two-component system nitrogen regulation sensor histidine kinase NtrY
MVERIRSILFKYIHGWAFLALMLLLLGLKITGEPSKKNFLNTFQDSFYQQERQLDRLSKQLKRDWRSLDQYAFAEKYKPANTPFFISIYRNDSLIYWNNNELPINAFADLHFPTEGLTQLQNGWYYSQLTKIGTVVIVSSFGIQRTYPYENDQLKNVFFAPFPQAKALVGFNKNDEHVVRNLKGEALFQLELDTTKNKDNTQVFMFFLVLLSFVVVWHFLITRSKKWWWKMIIASVLMFFMLYATVGNLFKWMITAELFDAQLLALNEWIPNLGELIFKGLLFILCVVSILKIKILRKRSTPLFVLGFIIPAGIIVMPCLAISLIENSTIPLELSTILELNQFTFYVLALLFSGVVLYGYMLHALFKQWCALKSKVVDLVFLFWLLFTTLIQWQAELVSWEALLWPTLLVVLIYAVHRLDRGSWSFTANLLALLIAAAATAVNVQKEWGKKERQERELYANELADNRDITAEMEFTLAREKLMEEAYLNRLFNVEEQPTFNELKEAMERRIFNGYWERFDIDLYYFRSNVNPTMNGFSQKEFEQLIEAHGDRSEIDSNLFFIRDFTSQFSYVFRHQIVSKNGEVIPIYGTLKSKKIPEEIGFPRLLISQQANVFESLEAYSIAKYYKGRLITNYGDYSYPIRLARLFNGNKSDQFWFESEGYSHFVLRKTPDDAIVLSREVPTMLSLITTIAFLLVGTGSVYAVVVFVRLRLTRKGPVKNVPLATRIQLVMIGLVFVSLLGFSVGSSRFVNDQYTDYTNDIIREKIRSVNREGLQWFEKNSDSSVVWTRDELAYQLRNWSQIFITDLNVYSVNGQLVASSRPKIYNIGLLGEQMDPDAMIALGQEKRSEFIHEEFIGDLSYLSAYVPVVSKNGQMLGHLNLQHFDQQNVFEAQVQRFFMAIVNVFMLLLVLSIIGAILVSNWITSPLRLVRRSFANVALGKRNQPIVYNSTDEIGELVAEYNNKIKEIEAAAQQLAQTERESAWREMAKQVAHEIKNPLTPMKLSIQQLQRVFDPNDPKAKDKLLKVSHSIIEQIDALTHIANAFSSFAKLPQPKMEPLDLIELLRSIDALYGANNEIDWDCDLGQIDVCLVNGDRDMLLRVLNNVVTNGIQAVPFDRKASIRLSISTTSEEALVEIIDNGSGIPEDQLQRIFEPYFTTKSTGTGLGLAMVKQIVESHGGSITVKATSDRGTTIRIVLPRVS